VDLAFRRTRIQGPSFFGKVHTNSRRDEEKGHRRVMGSGGVLFCRRCDGKGREGCGELVRFFTKWEKVVGFLVGGAKKGGGAGDGRDMQSPVAATIMRKGERTKWGTCSPEEYAR